MKNPLDLDPFHPDQARMSELSKIEMETLFVVAMNSMTLMRSVLFSIPYPCWQRISYEMRIRADNSKNAVHEYMAQTVWEVVSFIQKNGQLSDSTMLNPAVREELSKYGFPVEDWESED